MMLETSAYYGQPTGAPLPFSPQGGPGFPYAPPIWQLIGGALAHPQLGHLFPQLALAGQGIGGWPAAPFGGGAFGGPLGQYGPLAGQGIGGWLALPFGGGGFGGPLAQYAPVAGSFSRHPLLEAGHSMIMNPAFAPHGFLGSPLIGSPGGLHAMFWPRGLAGAGLPFQGAPQLAYGG